MKIKYVGAPDDGVEDGGTVEAYGLTFQKGKVLTVPDDKEGAGDILMRVKGNPHFALIGPEPNIETPENKPESPQPNAAPETYEGKA